MNRGVIKLTNKELDVLSKNAQVDDCYSDALLQKLTPVDENLDSKVVFDVFLSENEAETILDCMSAPNLNDDENLLSARTKIQQFIFQFRSGAS